MDYRIGIPLILIIGGGFLIKYLLSKLYKRAEIRYFDPLKDDKIEKPDVISGLIMGITERAAYTAFIGFNIPASGAFIGGWITAKAIGGWSFNPDRSKYRKELFSINLIASGISAILGIIAGFLIKPLICGK